MKDHLGLRSNFLGQNAFLSGKGMLPGDGGEEIPLAQLSKMQASVPVGGVHDGHIQLFLPHQVHQIFGRAFRQPETDSSVLCHIRGNFSCHRAA